MRIWGQNRLSSRLLARFTLAGALFCVLGLPSAADMLDGTALRPAMTATSYIRVLPSEPLSESFGVLIRDAVRRAASVEAAAARWQAEQYGVDAAVGAQLPSALLYGEAGLASGSLGNTPYAYGVRVSLPLYDGNSKGFATEAQRAVSGAAGYAAMDELAATLVDLVAAAAAIRRADQTLDFRRAQHAAMEDLLAAIVSERETGTASKVDTDQVEAQLAQIEIELRMAESARSQARESFARIAGEAPNHVGPIGSLARMLPSDRHRAIALALSGNPRLAQSLELASAAQLTHRSIAAGFGPDLSLDLDAGSSGNILGATSSRFEARAVMRLEIPFAFGTDAQVHKLALEAQAAEFEAVAAQTGVVAGIDGALQRLSATRRAQLLAYDALDRARSVLTGIKAERELGERSVFDLLTAQGALADAQIRLASMQYDLIVAEHILAAQLGQIAGIYGVALDGP